MSGSASSPASPQWRATGCVWTGARGVPTPTSHCWATHGPVWRAAWARHLGTRTVTSRCQSSSQSVPYPFIFHSVRKRHSPLFPSSVIRPPSSVGGLESEKWATDSASAISLQGLPFTSYFCHHYMVSGRAAPYIHITSSKRPHLWLRARHESSARKRNAAVRSELIKTRNEFLSDSAFGAENCFLSFSRIDNDLINRGQLRCTRFLALTFIKCSLVSCLIIHESF